MMESTFNIILVAGALLCYLLAVVLYIKSIKYRTDEFKTVNRGHIKNWWRPVWKQKALYTEKGYRLQIGFVTLVSVGAVLLVLGYSLPLK